MNLAIYHSDNRRRRAFTLIEILTAVAITTVIVFTLVSMFNTSAKALREANRQTDVWEAARASFGILQRSISEVTAGGETNRVNLFSGNGPSTMHLPIMNSAGVDLGDDLRLQDIYVLSRDNNNWVVNVFMIGLQRNTDPTNSAVKMLYRYQTNYPAVNQDGTMLAIDYPNLFDPNHAYIKALDALAKYLDDKANGIEPNGSISAMADGIVHLRLVAYASDGRAYTNSALLNPPPTDHYIDNDTMVFRNNDLPASLDLEMFVLAPDRIQEFRSQPGLAPQTLYLQNHLDSLQLFRTRIPIHRDLLATQ